MHQSLNLGVYTESVDTKVESGPASMECLCGRKGLHADSRTKQETDEKQRTIQSIGQKILGRKHKNAWGPFQRIGGKQSGLPKKKSV